MTPAQYEEYEKNRRAEDLEFAKLFEFQETLFCFDAATGATVWRKDRPSVYSRFVQSGTLTAADGKLYVLGAGRKARCFDAATGNDVWETTLPGEFIDEYFCSSFALADGAAIVFCGSLFGLDAKTGAILWAATCRRRKANTRSAVVWKADNRELVIANIAGGDTACFEPRTGIELWRVKSEANNSTPVVVGDRLITYGSSRRAGMRCYKISPSGAEEAWAYRGAADKGSSPVVVGDNVLRSRGEAAGVREPRDRRRELERDARSGVAAIHVARRRRRQGDLRLRRLALLRRRSDRVSAAVRREVQQDRPDGARGACIASN